MLNICKPLYKRRQTQRAKGVDQARPKMGCGQEEGADISPLADCAATGEEAGAKRSISEQTRNVVSQYGSSKEGKAAVRSSLKRAGKSDRRKRMPSCNGADTGCDIPRRASGQTSGPAGNGRVRCLRHEKA